MPHQEDNRLCQYFVDFLLFHFFHCAPTLPFTGLEAYCEESKDTDFIAILYSIVSRLAGMRCWLSNPTISKFAECSPQAYRLHSIHFDNNDFAVTGSLTHFKSRPFLKSKSASIDSPHLVALRATGSTPLRIASTMAPSLIELLPPEILHTTCSFLDDRDARSLRLTCKTIGAVADCYAFQQLTFYLHTGDFDMLRYFASHDIFAKNVRSLIYITDILPLRRLSFRKFLVRAKENAQKWVESMHPGARPRTRTDTRSKSSHSRPTFTDNDFRNVYNTYVELHERQARLLAGGEDFAVLKDVVPKFTRLRNIIVSADYWFRELEACSTPFDDILIPARDELDPKACRQTGSLLMPLVGLSPRIQSLCLGEIHWSFFDRLHDPLRLTQMVEICRNLTTFNVHIDTGHPTRGTEPTFASECTRTFQQGDVRRLLEAMPKLESLTIGFTMMDEHNDIYPARLEDLVSMNTHWQRLKHVKFEILEAPRQDLIDFFSRHSSTLRTIELRDLRLIRSSWRVFLPQLQELAENMFLDDILVSGWARGEAEENEIAPESREESFNFGDPQHSSTPCLSDDITDFIIWGEGANPLDNFP